MVMQTHVWEMLYPSTIKMLKVSLADTDVTSTPQRGDVVDRDTVLERDNQGFHYMRDK